MKETWTAYCRKIALGSGHAACCAKACLRLTTRTPSAATIKLDQQLENKKITPEEYETRAYAVELIRDMWREGTQTHIDTCDELGGWQSIGNGCHQKKTHINL